MSQKRMFDKAIIDTDKFMDLPMSAKALYFLMGMEADDEGFVSPRKVQRVYGGTDDDVKILVSKGFIIPFESGVVVITDWNNNNWLDARRIKPTKYQEEKRLLAINKDKMYVLSECLALAKPEESSIEESSIEERSSTAIKNQNKKIVSEASDLDKKMFDIHWAPVLKTVPNYPFDEEKDLAHFIVLLKSYPNVRLRKVLDKWAVQKKTTKPIVKGSKPRQEINSWVSRAKGDELK